MSTKTKIPKEVVEVETKSNGRPVRSSAKPVSYKEESVNKRGQVSSEPANRKKKGNSNSNESAVPSKKAAAGKKKPENGNAVDVEAPANENVSKGASRKRKNDTPAVDDKVSAEKVNGSKAAKPRQKKIEEAVFEDDDSELEDAPEPDAKKETKPVSRKNVKEPIEDSSNGNGNPGTSKPVVPKASKGKKTAKQPVTENEADYEDDDESQATSKAAAKVKGKKKAKEPVVATVADDIDDENDDEEKVPAKPVASKTAKGKKTTKGSTNVETEDAEEEADDKKKTSRQPKKPKEASTKATSSKSAKAKEDEQVSNVAGRQRAAKRRLAPTQDETDVPKVFKKSARTQAAPSKTKAAPATEQLNNITSDSSQIDYSLPTKEWNFKISSWNVAGLRSVIQKNGMKFVEKENPDIFCVQETKCLPEEVPDHLPDHKYHKYWFGKKGGKGGVGLYSKVMPYNIEYGINNEEMDSEARIITAEYTKFYVVCVYVPNAGRKLVTLPKRLEWDKLFQDHLVKLNKKKPVIIVGDMNVSHLEIDLANPKSNKRNAGFTTEERNGMTHLLSLGFVDTFRALYPDRRNAYTFWSYMFNSRSKNIGWRLDYFIVSERLMDKVVDNVIRSDVMGSDHCPLTLFLNI